MPLHVSRRSYFVLQDKGVGLVELTFYDSLESYETKADSPLGVVSLTADTTVQALQGEVSHDQRFQSAMVVPR